MEPFKQKIKRFKKNWNQRKYRISIVGACPSFDWKIILIINVVIFIYLIYFSVDLYKDIKYSNNVSGDNNVYKTETVDIDSIQNNLADFETKKLILEQLSTKLKQNK